MMELDLGRVMARSAFALEVLCCVMIYLYGSNNFVQLKQLKSACKSLTLDIAEKQREITQLEQRIIAWNLDPFYKEKIAREQLNMSNEGDLVYLMQ